MNTEALSHIQEWKELNQENDVNNKIWTAVGLLRRDILEQENVWENMDELDEKIGNLRKFIPRLIRFLNKTKDVDIWRNNQKLWILKKFNNNVMTFSRIVNGKEEVVKISKKLFDRIKNNDFEGFSIELREKNVREYILGNGEIELSESFLNYLKNFKLPINVTIDKLTKKSRKEKVLKLLKEGKRNKDIAKEIGVQPASITRYKKGFQKRGLLNEYYSGE